MGKKIKAALDRLGIQGVVDGYVTQTALGAAFTGWDKHGKPIVLLLKRPWIPKWEKWQKYS